METETAVLPNASQSLVAHLDTDALNRLLRIYAAVIGAGVAATAAVAHIV